MIFFIKQGNKQWHMSKARNKQTTKQVTTSQGVCNLTFFFHFTIFSFSFYEKSSPQMLQATRFRLKGLRRQTDFSNPQETKKIANQSLKL